jgi:hypothetical protein
MKNSISILAIAGMLSMVGLLAGFGVSPPGAAAEAVQVNSGIGDNNPSGTTPIGDALIADPNCGHYSSKLISNV